MYPCNCGPGGNGGGGGGSYPCGDCDEDAPETYEIVIPALTNSWTTTEDPAQVCELFPGTHILPVSSELECLYELNEYYLERYTDSGPTTWDVRLRWRGGPGNSNGHPFFLVEYNERPTGSDPENPFGWGATLRLVHYRNQSITSPHSNCNEFSLNRVLPQPDILQSGLYDNCQTWPDTLTMTAGA